MKFFDSLISEAFHLTQKHSSVNHSICNDLWNDLGYSQVILQRDTAFELNGTGFSLITTMPIENEVIVVGDDLYNIGNNRCFARISVVQIEEEADEQKLYNLIRKIDYVKYHHFPEGYMIRTSSKAHKESVRVSKISLKNNISFQKVGSLLISQYKKIPAVIGAKVIYITDPEVDFDKIGLLAEKNKTIVETFNHIMNNVTFDCDSCNLKAVCDEVEGMKELHFKNASMR